MTFDQKQKTALFRYSVIAPLETGNSDPSMSNKEFFRQKLADLMPSFRKAGKMKGSAESLIRTCSPRFCF